MVYMIPCMEYIVKPIANSFYEYDILQKYEGGLSLKGSEVKAIRENKANIKESYIRIKDDELFIIGMNIGKYSGNIDLFQKLCLQKQVI